jgi:hypothetical protein
MRSAVVATCALVLIASLVSYGTATSPDYSGKTVNELIDDLTQIKSESPGISSAYITHDAFIAEDTPSFRKGNGEVAREVPPPMRELARRGPLALPELIEHLNDKRPTKLEVGIPPRGFGYSGKYFGYDYDPRVRDWEQIAPAPKFPHWSGTSFNTYTLKVGDICFALIGQIVNRHLRAVFPVPTGFLVVNSPIEDPDLVERVKSDWGSGDAETVKASLLADIYRSSPLTGINQDLYIEIVANPALRRLKLYFPEDYRELRGDLPRKADFQRSR